MHLIHDLRNLLTVASVSVKNTQATRRTESQASQELDVVSQCLDSMFELVDEFFSTTEVLAAPVQSVDLGDVIADRIGMVRAAIGSNIVLEVEPTTADCLVMARPIDLERILLNLVLNAVEAMPDGGVLRVRATLVESQSQVADLNGQSHVSVRLTVSDTGRGMPRQWEQQLFKRLAFDEAGGRGLGLASVNLIVLRLGGRFHVNSREATGTEVHIDLPRAKLWLPQ
jgi:signal transduction histidine kinase